MQRYTFQTEVIFKVCVKTFGTLIKSQYFFFITADTAYSSFIMLEMYCKFSRIALWDIVSHAIYSIHILAGYFHNQKYYSLSKAGVSFS